MKLKTLLGTTIIVLGCIVSSNAAFAGSHEKKMQNKKCQNGYNLYHNKRGTNKCLRQGGNGWYRLNGKQVSMPGFGKVQNNNGFTGARQKVLWKISQGLKIGYCQNRGYTAYYKGHGQGKQWGCFKKRQNGWSVYRYNAQKPSGFSEGGAQVKWKGNNGQRIAFCQDRGYTPYYKGQGQGRKWGCFKKRQNGWNIYKFVGSQNGLQHNMKYDGYRWENNGKVGCKKGTAWYKNYQLHCSG